jgi:hypothetical protein
VPLLLLLLLLLLVSVPFATHRRIKFTIKATGIFIKNAFRLATARQNAKNIGGAKESKMNSNFNFQFPIFQFSIFHHQDFLSGYKTVSLFIVETKLYTNI